MLHKSDEEREVVIQWLAGCDTGNSSRSLAFEYLGKEYHWPNAPYDPADLGRCLRLIEIAPGVRSAIDSLAQSHDRWSKAALVWDEMAALMEEEVGIHWEKGDRAPRTYKFMKDAGL